jgi:hypothetical protein
VICCRDEGEAAEPGAPAMGAKGLCIPFDQPAKITASDKCILHVRMLLNITPCLEEVTNLALCYIHVIIYLCHLINVEIKIINSIMD